MWGIKSLKLQGELARNLTLSQKDNGRTSFTNLKTKRQQQSKGGVGGMASVPKERLLSAEKESLSFVTY